MVSHNTAKLQALARELQETKLDQDVTEKVRRLGIPAVAWPLMAVFGAAAQYDELRITVEKASQALDTVVKSLGRTVGGIATYYERMEDEHGEAFDTADAKLKGER
ncbi:hypothetical protein [Tenggerimyces flavus]|uniref:Excreted virulence factor EspC (Type VII ESX diderm) n=1 Tax=Tenggerimyces flavus TaxID=1708749 RepID=A0ABV7YMD4_9ACTN|nr:hypothetical protein [Tenggerimyces flavus]MBM7789699.1 hypothetical protein [Tenggerimyces flavus]